MPICPICELLFKVDDRWGYLEDGIHIHTCERCHAALMNLVLMRKLGRYRSGDARKLLRQELARNAERL